MRRQNKRDRARSQLNIGCGHDTTENVDLEQQLVKNRKARPEQEQCVRQPDTVSIFSLALEVVNRRIWGMTSIQLYTWKDSIIDGNLRY